MTGKQTGGVRLAFLAAAVSGFAVFINGYGVRAVPDATVYTTAKNLVAAALLGAAALAVPRLRRPPATGPALRRPARLAGLAAVAVVGGAVPFVLFFEGLARASSTHAAFIHKTLFLWVALFAAPLLGERLRALHAVAAALLVGGLVLLDGDLAGFAFGGGELLVLAATLLWTVEVVVAKRLLRGVAPATLALARMGGGVALLVGWVALTGRLDTLLGLGGRGWLWAVATGAVLGCYVLTWFTALARAQAVDVAAILVAGAVLTGVLNAAVRGIAVDLAGIGLLAAGAAVVAVAAAAAGGRRPGIAAGP
ncbi:MAG TPA: EamA family transporter [Micromonosporaceae bacterium]|nr:EamA family transporter [Micromonosporaceae bacterium]